MGTNVDCNNYCRLCCTRTESQLTLFSDDDPNTTALALKLKQFLNLQASPVDRLPKVVCTNCAANLDFCIQFVDRARRIDNHWRNGSDIEYIQSDITYRYPYLYHQTTNNATNNTFNPEQGCSFFGSSAQFVADNNYVNNSKKTEQQQQQERVPMYRQDITVDNVVVEVEPTDIYNSSCESSSKKSAEVVDENPSRKIRKILPKTLASNAAKMETTQVTVGNNMFNVKPMSQIMIPVTVKTPCKTCGVVINAAGMHDLQNHVCSAKDKNVSCSVDGCDKRFFSKTTLRYHLKHYHRVNQKPSSSEDEEGQQQSARVNSSPVLVGTTSKKFACSHSGCTKSYTSNNYLVEHKRQHTGERPFQCSNCDKTFYRILDMKKHKLLKVCH